MGELAEAFVHETRVSIDYYRRRFLGEPGVTKVYLLSSKEIDPKRIEELTTALDLPVEVGQPFKRVLLEKEAPPSGLAVATGLALRGLEAKPKEINLLPPSQRAQFQGLTQPVAIRAVAAVLLLGLGQGLATWELNEWRNKITAVQIAQLRPPNLRPEMPLSELQALRQDRQREAQFLRDLSEKKKRYSALLKELTHLLPEEVWLQQATIEEAKEGAGGLSYREVLKLTGSCYANNRDRELEGINGFLTSLRSSTLFNSTFASFNLDSVQRGRFREEEITDFRISCGPSSEVQR